MTETPLSAAQYSWGELLALLARRKSGKRETNRIDEYVERHLDNYINRLRGPLTSSETRRCIQSIVTISQEHDLSIWKAARLARRLFNMWLSFRIRDATEDSPSQSSIGKELGKIHQSVVRIMKLAQREDKLAALSIAALHGTLQNALLAAKDWEDNGILHAGDHFPGEAVLLAKWRESESVVREWFDLAEAMAFGIEKIRSNSNKFTRVDGRERIASLRPFGLSPTVWLVGKELPMLYEYVTGKPFEITRVTSKDSARALGIQEVSGARFVKIALSGVGLGTISLETIAAYRTECVRLRLA